MRQPSNDAVATWTPVSHILCLHLLIIMILIVILNHDFEYQGHDFDNGGD